MEINNLQLKNYLDKNYNEIAKRRNTEEISLEEILPDDLENFSYLINFSFDSFDNLKSIRLNAIYFIKIFENISISWLEENLSTSSLFKLEEIIIVTALNSNRLNWDKKYLEIVRRISRDKEFGDHCKFIEFPLKSFLNKMLSEGKKKPKPLNFLNLLRKDIEYLFLSQYQNQIEDNNTLENELKEAKVEIEKYKKEQANKEKELARKDFLIKKAGERRMEEAKKSKEEIKLLENDKRSLKEENDYLNSELDKLKKINEDLKSIIEREKRLLEDERKNNFDLQREELKKEFLENISKSNQSDYNLIGREEIIKELKIQIIKLKSSRDVFFERIIHLCSNTSFLETTLKKIKEDELKSLKKSPKGKEKEEIKKKTEEKFRKEAEEIIKEEERSQWREIEKNEEEKMRKIISSLQQQELIEQS